MSKLSRKCRLALSLAIMLSGATAVAPAFAQVYVQAPMIRVAPPPLRREFAPPPPGPPAFWYWQPGFWRWDGRAYFWAPGRWHRRPHPRAIWVEPRWEQHGGGWVYRRGYWH